MVCTITPTRNSQRISGPNTMTSRGHRNVSQADPERATRIIAGPRMCAASGASGSLRIGIGGSLPARQTRPSSATAEEPERPGPDGVSVMLITL